MLRAHLHTIALTDGWELVRRAPNRPLKAALASADGWFPGSVHKALLAADHFPHPFLALHEGLVLGRRGRMTLPPPLRGSTDPGNQRAARTFDGLASENMFVPARADVTDILHQGANELASIFASAYGARSA